MCGPAIPYIIMAVTAAAKGVSDYQQGQYANKVANYNARTMDNSAIQTRNKGVEAENAHREKVQQLISNQRAAIGANGVDLNSGSPLQLQQDAELMGNVDALRIRSNYSEAADALNDKAVLTRAEGAASKKAGIRSIITGGVQAAGQMYQGGVAGGWYDQKSAINSSTVFDSPSGTAQSSWLSQPNTAMA